MGVSLNILTWSIKEGCCKELEKYKNRIICKDDCKFQCELRDGEFSFCDYIIELNDKYILIEEKSFLLEYVKTFSRDKEINIRFNGRDEILNEILNKIDNLNNIEKKRLIATLSILSLTITSNKKMKDSILFLMKNFNNFDKLKKSIMVYLYCKSNHPAEKVFNSINNLRNIDKTLVSCDKLEKLLIKLGAK